MRLLVLVALACLSACSWFGSKRQPAPNPTEIVVTGTTAGSIIFIDGKAAGPATTADDHPQIVRVAPGAHTVEIHLHDAIVYREDSYVRRGETSVVTVLSGLNR